VQTPGIDAATELSRKRKWTTCGAPVTSCKGNPVFRCISVYLLHHTERLTKMKNQTATLQGKHKFLGLMFFSMLHTGPQFYEEDGLGLQAEDSLASSDAMRNRENQLKKVVLAEVPRLFQNIIGKALPHLSASVKSEGDQRRSAGIKGKGKAASSAHKKMALYQKLLSRIMSAPLLRLSI